MQPIYEVTDQIEEMVGVVDSGEFSITMNAETFRILSDSLYSNKTRAIVREWSTNALDAMIAAGKCNEPFSVHLPTSFEPWFSVKDTGIGISHEDFMSLICTYFSSSKKNDNSQTGFFGLGSKVGFAYKDQFTVIAVHNGVKRFYSCSKDTGAPKAVLLQEEKTDEPNGTEFQIDVDPNDFRDFAHEAKYVYKWFDTIPVFNTSLTVESATKSPIVEGLYNSDSYVCYIKTGPVVYPLDSTDVKNPFNRSFVLEMPLGTVSVTPSRESIDMNPTTKKNIIDALARKADEVLKMELEKVEACKTPYEKQVAMNTLFVHGLMYRDVYTAKFGHKYYNDSIGTLTASDEIKFYTKKGNVDKPSVFIHTKLYDGRTKNLSRKRSKLTNAIVAVPTDACKDFDKALATILDKAGLTGMPVLSMDDIVVDTSTTSKYAPVIKVFKNSSHISHCWKNADKSVDELDNAVYVLIKGVTPYDKNNEKYPYEQNNFMLAQIYLLILDFDPHFVLYGIPTSMKDQIPDTMVHLDDFVKNFIVRYNLADKVRTLWSNYNTTRIIHRLNDIERTLGKSFTKNEQVVKLLDAYKNRKQTRNTYYLSSAILQKYASDVNDTVYEELLKCVGHVQHHPAFGSVVTSNKTYYPFLFNVIENIELLSGDMN